VVGDPDYHYHRSRPAGGVGAPDLDSVVDGVILKIERTRPERLRQNYRHFLMRHWHPAAGARWPNGVGTDVHGDVETELVETSIALAAGIGFSEQLGRGIRVMRSLQRLSIMADTVLATARPYTSRRARATGTTASLLSGVRTAVDDLLSEFVYDPNRLYQGDGGRDANARDRRRRRLEEYLVYHTREEAIVREFDDSLAAVFDDATLAGMLPAAVAALLGVLSARGIQLYHDLAENFRRAVQNDGSLPAADDDLVAGLRGYSNRLRRRLTRQ